MDEGFAENQPAWFLRGRLVRTCSRAGVTLYIRQCARDCCHLYNTCTTSCFTITLAGSLGKGRWWYCIILEYIWRLINNEQGNLDATFPILSYHFSLLSSWAPRARAPCFGTDSDFYHVLPPCRLHLYLANLPSLSYSFIRSDWIALPRPPRPSSKSSRYSSLT